MRRGAVLGLIACAWAASAFAQRTLTLDEAVALAKRQNPDVVIARKQVEAARGGVIEARSGYLPSVVSSGLLRRRTQQEDTRLRNSDYNASLRIVQNVYSGGAVRSSVAIARLIQEQRELELAAVVNRVAMDLRVAYYELLLNRSKIGVREQSVRVMQEELKTQQERFSAGTVGELNVRRAEVSLANEQPELFDAQAHLQNSYLRVGELCGLTSGAEKFQAGGELQYQARRPDLNECLAYAYATRPEIRARQIDVEIEEQQLTVDQSETRPRVEVFSGYEVYSERDPEVGDEFNHGYVVGLNASWHLFDGYATRGRLQATRARREAAIQALQAAQRTVETEVRSAFFELQQSDRVMESETQNVQSASEALEIARGNLGAGLGTQLEVLQATSDVTRTRTTRLNAIYQHNVALARLARATAREPRELGFTGRATMEADERSEARVLSVARPPGALSKR
jgi:outer membrane protein TolC